MHSFPSIGQYREAVRYVKDRTRYVGKDIDGNPIYDESRKLPTLKFEGTVKLHGSNGAVALNLATDKLTYQSRSRVLQLTSDNAGFMLHMMGKEAIIREIIEKIKPDFIEDDSVTDIVLFGEWCGQGIQKSVAIAELPKMFVVFGVKLITNDDTNRWLTLSDYNIDYPETRIFSIHNFPTYEIEIDFNFPELVQNKLIEITTAVEEECPVGKAFGVAGIGEGVVWKSTSDITGSGSWFKIKGEKHSVSKVRTLASVDVEAVANLKEFVDSTVTEARLEQALDNIVREQMLPFEMKSLGDFIRWVYNDIMKEEQDTIVENGIDPKKIGSAVANIARPWYIKKFNERN